MQTCACGEPATANGTECPTHFRERLGSVANLYAPSSSSTAGAGLTANRRWDARLGRYAQARSEGIQPRTTSTRDIDTARRISDHIQAPFSARAEGA